MDSTQKDSLGRVKKDEKRGAPVTRRWPLLTLASFALLIAVVIVAAVSVKITAKDASLLSGQLQQVGANALLEARQLDDLFRQLVEAGTFDGSLSESSQAILQTWIEYDKQFLSQNEGNPVLQAERATAHRRVGYGLSRLQRHREAADHFGQAITLLEELGRKNPAVLRYADETVATYVRLAGSLEDLGRREESAAAIDRASKILEEVVSDYVPEHELQHRIVSLFEDLTKLSIERSESERAIRRMADVVEMRRRLLDGYPQYVTYAQALGDSCVALEDLLQRMGRYKEATNVHADSLVILEGLVRRFPDDARLRGALARMRTRQASRLSDG